MGALTQANSAITSHPGNNSVTGYGGTGAGGKYDIMQRLFGHTPDMSYAMMTPQQQNNIAQGDRRYGQGQIEQAFNSPARDKQYADYMASLTQLGNDQLNQQKTVADRNLKFANARTGMTGGSVAADEGGTLQRDYQGGLLSVADNARSSTDALRSSDQAEKNNLIELNNAGANVGQGTTDALNASRLALTNTDRTNQIGALGDVFGNLASQYQKYRAATAPPVSAWG